MNLRNRYYKYFCEISCIAGIAEEELAEKILLLDIGEKIVAQNYIIRLKQRTESHGQTLYHICIYDKTGRLVRNDPVFLSPPKRATHL